MKEKEPWEMTREEFKKQSYSEIFDIYERINPFKPNATLKRYVDELNKYLKKAFEEKVPQSWMQLFNLLGQVYSDIEAKQPNKIPYHLKKEVAESYGFRVEPGHRLIGFDSVILPDIHRQIVEQALKEGKPVPDEVLKDYPDLAEKYSRAVKEQEKEKLSDREMRVIERLKALGVKIDEPPIINMVGKTKTVVGKIDNYRLNFVVGDIQKEDMEEFDTLKIGDKVLWVKKSPMLSMLKEKLRRGEKKPKVMKLVPEYGGLKRFERQDITLTEKLQLKYLKEHGNL